MSTYKTNNRQRVGLKIYILAKIWVLAFSLAGCTRSASPDQNADGNAVETEAAQTFEEQLSAVQNGTSDEIRLERTPVDSGQVRMLAELTAELRTLVLDAGVVQDSDVAAFSSLKSLEHLRLRESPLTDAGLTELGRGQLDALIILNLPQARPTAVGLEELGRLPRLRQLRIGGRQIDDAAVKSLADWPALTSLHLIQPAITDASLKTIAGMDQLTSFYLDECPLSDSAWEEFFALRPKLHVHIDQSHHDLDAHADH